MSSNIDRKQAIRKYKEQKIPLGTYAVRCTATGDVWIGASRNLDATKNSCWFSLRHNGHPNKTLQKEWNEYGADAFVYEVLETLEDDPTPLAIPDLLKEQT